MFRKRGAPVFLELLTGGTKAPGVRAPKPPASPPERPAPLFQAQASGKTVAAVESKPTPEVPAPLPASLIEERSGELLGASPKIWIYVAALGFMAIIVWVIAYSAGKHSVLEDAEREKGQWAKRYAEGATQDPLESNKRQADPRPPTPAPPSPGPQTKPTPPAPVPVAASSLEKGSNYLVVATLMKRDADEAAAFLAANKLPTMLVSTAGKPIDLSSPEANNVQWMVVVLRGYAAADFRKLDTERMALVNQVQSLGRKWKTENKKAPTDFSQVFWWKFKGS